MFPKENRTMSGETEVEAREESKEKKRSKRKRWGTAPAEELSAPVRVSEPNPITAMSSVAELLAAEAEKRRRGDQPKASKKVRRSARNAVYVELTRRLSMSCVASN